MASLLHKLVKHFGSNAYACGRWEKKELSCALCLKTLLAEWVANSFLTENTGLVDSLFLMKPPADKRLLHGSFDSVQD